MPQKQITQTLLKLSAICIFIGRAYQFYFFGAPFRAVFWDESMLTPLVEGLTNYSWYDYATSLTVNIWINNFTKLCGFFMFISSFAFLLWDRIASNILKKYISYINLFILLFLGFCMTRYRDFGIVEFFELSIQIAICLIFLLNNDLKRINEKRLAFWLKIAVALTFIAHGILAMGIFYLPGHFIDMSIQILGINETQARLFLNIVGVLDIVLPLLLFIPKLAKYVLIYIIIWGFLTALARLVSGFNSDLILSSFHNHTYLVLYRLPHGLVPLIIFYIITKYNKKPLQI